jgi:hypothetical protein
MKRGPRLTCERGRAISPLLRTGTVLLCWRITNCAPSTTSGFLSITRRKRSRTSNADPEIGSSSINKSPPGCARNDHRRKDELKLFAPGDVARVAKKSNAPLRVNVYHAVRSDLYALTYKEYWHRFQRLFESTNLIAIGEPLVRAMADPTTRRKGG